MSEIKWTTDPAGNVLITNGGPGTITAAPLPWNHAPTERQLTAGAGIRIAEDWTVDVRPDLATRLHAFADWIARTAHDIHVTELKGRVCALIDGRPYQPPQPPLSKPHQPSREAPPMAVKLMRVMRLHYDGTLTDQTAATALREVLDEHAPEPQPEVVTHHLRCTTCRRAYGFVKVLEGTWVTPVCHGCALEGRTKER